MTTGKPATVMAPERAAPVFGATVIAAGAVRVTQSRALEAVQEQPAGAVTVTDAEPPAAGKVPGAGPTEYPQSWTSPMAVTSEAVSLAVLVSPPPETVAMLMTLAGASASTFTVRAMAG